MALKLDFNIYTTDDCNSLIIEDSTGRYSEDNLGGWGGINIDGNRLTETLNATIKVYFYIGDVLQTAEGSFSFGTFENFIEYPFSNQLVGFKLALPIENIKQQISAIDHFDSIEDNIYQITVSAYSINTTPEQIYGTTEKVFKNTCSISKLVSKALTSANVQCKDCDDSDVENALLAKSLLESLDNI
mgnify:CR=1 FL=1|tara:strand:+ start:149 stop:709 length:561 start_codon:yes stop_codon:yes gene_type:complete